MIPRSIAVSIAVTALLALVGVSDRVLGDLAVIGSFGNGGRYGGEFGIARWLDTDSKGNLYVGESVGGDRIQKFAFKGFRRKG